MGDTRRFSFAEHREADVWTTLNGGLRSVKSWWRSRVIDAPQGRVVDLTGEHAPPDDGVDQSDLVAATRDAVVESMGREIERLRRELNTRDAEIVKVLQRLVDGHERVLDDLENDRRERRILADALIRLERRLPSSDQPRAVTEAFPTTQVVGGTINPSIEAPMTANGNGRETPQSRLQPSAETPDDDPSPDDQPSS